MHSHLEKLSIFKFSFLKKEKKKDTFKKSQVASKREKDANTNTQLETLNCVRLAQNHC